MKRHFTREQVESYVLGYQQPGWKRTNEHVEIVDVLLLQVAQPMWVVKLKVMPNNNDDRRPYHGHILHDIIEEYKDYKQEWRLVPVVEAHLPTGCTTVAEEDRDLSAYQKDRLDRLLKMPEQEETGTIVHTCRVCGVEVRRIKPGQITTCDLPMHCGQLTTSATLS